MTGVWTATLLVLCGAALRAAAQQRAPVKPPNPAATQLLARGASGYKVTTDNQTTSAWRLAVRTVVVVVVGFCAQRDAL